jgi:TPR repeat protein
VNGVRDAAVTAEAYRIAAEGGDAYAHLRLGYLFETGDGVPQDYTEARAHYQAAVAAGLNEARLRLAICYLEGWGGPADRPAFAREMRAAAESGYIPAQQILAAMYFIGLAVPKDQAQSLSWLERAAAHDDPWSQVEIGHQLEAAHRQVLTPDLALVRSWYQLSAEQEYLDGSRAMARTFLSGERKDRNWELG